MPTCAKLVSLPDGSMVLALDTSATNLTMCAYVVESGLEVNNSLLSMTAQDGGVFVAGLITCWLTAFGIRSIIEIIRGSSE